MEMILNFEFAPNPLAFEAYAATPATHKCECQGLSIVTFVS
jgi:hypothetical protein